jgi:hypothetical protein
MPRARFLRCRHRSRRRGGSDSQPEGFSVTSHAEAVRSVLPGAMHGEPQTCPAASVEPQDTGVGFTIDEAAMDDPNDLGWLYLVIDVGAVILLGVILAYGTISYRRFRVRRRNEMLGEPNMRRK